MKNNGKKESKLYDILKKETKGEKIILFIMSIIAIVMGVLLLTGVWKVEEGFLDNEFVPIILLALGLLSLIISVYNFFKQKKGNIFFQKFYDYHINNSMKSKLVGKGIEYEMEEEYDKVLDLLILCVKVNIGIEIYLMVSRESYIFGIDTTTNTNFDDIISDKDIEKIFDQRVEVGAYSEVELEKVFSDFYEFVLKNEDLSNEIYEKYKDKIEFVEE